jgi:hypothetical protein
MSFTAVDLQHFRFKTLLIFHDPGAKRAFGGGRSPPSAAYGGCSQTAPQFAPNARNVRNFHRLIYHGIGMNLEVHVFHRC